MFCGCCIEVKIHIELILLNFSSTARVSTAAAGEQTIRCLRPCLQLAVKAKLPSPLVLSPAKAIARNCLFMVVCERAGDWVVSEQLLAVACVRLIACGRATRKQLRAIAYGQLLVIESERLVCERAAACDCVRAIDCLRASNAKVIASNCL